MTNVTLLYDNNLTIGFKLEGHAGLNKSGPDILCAALSAITQLTINGILDWVGLGVEESIKEQHEKDAILWFETKIYESSVVQQLFKSFEMYVESLVEMYEGYVKLERRQANDNTN